jgi:hypothetical protein
MHLTADAEDAAATRMDDLVKSVAVTNDQGNFIDSVRY